MTSEEHAHHFSSWTKERLAEMDATTSIETQFQGTLHKQQHEGEAAWAKAKTALDENLSWKTGAMPSNPMAAVFKGAQDRAMGASMGAMPSNLMTAGFKDVQDRALHIARENAESVFAFAGKISNALTPQDIVTLQTRFAQDQMQAFAAQTQELQRLMGETLQKLQRG